MAWVIFLCLMACNANKVPVATVGAGQPTGAVAEGAPVDAVPGSIRAALADPAALAGLGRVVPVRDDAGGFAGLRVTALRAEGLPARAGLQNGDVVQRVNGQSIASLDDLLAAHVALQQPGVTTVTLALLRDGAPLELVLPLDQPLADVQGELPLP